MSSQEWKAKLGIGRLCRESAVSFSLGLILRVDGIHTFLSDQALATSR